MIRQAAVQSCPLLANPNSTKSRAVCLDRAVGEDQDRRLAAELQTYALQCVGGSAATALPVDTSPVSATIRTLGCATIALPASASPRTRLRTPAR